jgi:N-acetylglucosamine-6-phosphate deacetylase
MKISCTFFFDGDTLSGPSEITLSQTNRFLAIETYFGESPDYYLIAPGFVDLQVNGYNTIDINNATAEDFTQLNKDLYQRGTTTWLATLLTAPLSDISKRLAILGRSIDGGCAGFHLEGPFLGRSVGAHQKGHIIPIDLEWLSALPPSVKLVTLAPEQTYAAQGIALLKRNGIRVSLGHSQPTEAEYETAVASGATMLTHLFNAMSGVHHRDMGLALMGLTDDRVSVGLIADLVHVQPAAIKLAFKNAKVYLVSDSIGWASSNTINVIDGAPRLANGTLAGSGITMAEAVRNCVNVCGVSLEQVLKAATSTPADLIGLPHAGRLKIGACQPMLFLNSGLHIQKIG